MTDTVVAVQNELLELVLVETPAPTVVTEEPVNIVVASLGQQGPQGIQGPPGPPGASGEEEMVYSKRTDFLGDNLIYRGEAAVGSAESATAWRIRKIVLDLDGDVTETWATGTAAFDKAWTLRQTYVYS